jgi:amino acid adenylation domain-containing protein
MGKNSEAVGSMPERQSVRQTNRCVHELFAKQARLHPDRVAVVFEKEQITYGELNHRANHLAQRLAQMGVGKETPVAIFMERSPWMIVAMLAILKAGGCYVPLDSNYPAERLAFMLSDTEVPVLLTQRALVEKILPGNACMLFPDEQDSGGQPDEFSAQHSSPENLAYIMFTSGSTGMPKGVAIPHRGIVRLVKGADYASFGPDETFLQLAPVSFDASTFEIWGALLNGGKLVMMPPGQPSLEEIGAAIRNHGVTTLWLTAGLFHLMIDERIGDLQPLRQLLAGGDVLSPPHVRKALRELPATRLINGYGPTENTTFTCCHTISSDEPEGAPVPIGRPINGTTVYILGEKLQPLPQGETGELHIGGTGLARGYWRRPELTAKKFIPDPFAQEPGSLLYSTGDLVRSRADGVIEFLGRVDAQVKIRGFRVELGEIECALAQHEAVRSAVVTVQGNERSKEIIAYFVPENGAATTSAALRDWLREKLPDYMIPAVFVPMRTLPLTANGKIDRRSLPAPQQTRSQSFIAPKTDLERSVAEIWRSVLGSGEIGTADNFFDIGGDSIRLMDVHAKLVRALRRPFSVTVLFQYPTVASLAHFLESAPQKAAVSSALERAQKQRAAFANKPFKSLQK